MGSWLDFLMLAMALGAGWLGWVGLTLAGWRPLPPARDAGWAACRSPRAAGQVVNSQAVDGDR